MKKLIILPAIILAVAAAGVVSLPSPIDSVAVNASRPLDFAGILAPNDMLQSTQITKLPAGKAGGEDIAKIPRRHRERHRPLRRAQ